MKNKIYIFLMVIAALTFASCEKYTTITPKGKNILNRVSDFDYLMNFNYVGNNFKFDEPAALVNDIYPRLVNVPNAISSPNKDLNYTLITYDETIDRVNLTTSDIKYENLYSIISTVANIVIENIDQANGDRSKANQLKAEAYVLRAYFHYLLVNLYAKAYDPATAETDGGIPYVNKIDYETDYAKNTVQEVYDNMLSDLDAALNLNSLPDKPQNSMRVGSGFAYAVKARVLLSMRNYTGALEAANKGLSINNILEDHRPFLSVEDGGSGMSVSRDMLTSPDNLFFASINSAGPFGYGASIEMINYYEPGNILKYYSNKWVNLSSYTGVPGNLLWWTGDYQANLLGLTTSDLYLIKAECLARNNNNSAAMDEINYIRERRIRPADYEPLSGASEAVVMEHLMRTARVENLFTYKNFIDIKRWNAEGTYAQTITRTIDGITYTLNPDSDLWIFPFPQSATNYNPLLTQNY